MGGATINAKRHQKFCFRCLIKSMIEFMLKFIIAKLRNQITSCAGMTE